MMLNLFSLTITNGINDVTGIRYATNLESISIDSDNVLGLDELSTLSKLKLVELGFNKRIDVSFLEGCMFVERIVFNNSEFVNSDASYLVMSPNLKSIFYYEFSGKGINFLLNGINLETITIYHAFGSTEDLSFLLDLVNLEIITILVYFSLSESQTTVLENLITNGVQVVLM
jgi:hypothetical protein